MSKSSDDMVTLYHFTNREAWTDIVLDGEIQPYNHVGRAIADAVEYGWLTEGSYWGCLIVPKRSILRGKLDVKAKRCPQASRHARVRCTNPPLNGGFEGAKSTSDGGFVSRSSRSLADSTLKPLSSSLYAVPEPKEGSA